MIPALMPVFGATCIPTVCEYGRIFTFADPVPKVQGQCILRGIFS